MTTPAQYDESRAALGDEHLALLGPDRYGVAELRPDPDHRVATAHVTFGNAPARALGDVVLADDDGWAREDVGAQVAALVDPMRLQTTNMSRGDRYGVILFRLTPQEGTDGPV